MNCLTALLPEEERRLRELLKQAGQNPPALDEGIGEERPAGEDAEPCTGPIRRLGRMLPELLFFRFVVNLHCTLRDRTRAEDEHVKLLLESCFPSGAAGRRLYRESTALRPSDPLQVRGLDAQGSD